MNYIVIPAYQPDNKLIKLIEKIHEKSDFRILVIDDGSSSNCQNIFDKAEQYATVLRHQVNQGKGQALKTAFDYIRQQNSYGTVVTADADGQHKIWDILRTANKASENPNKKCFKKNVISYTLITIFFFAFSRIYEAFSFGETSVHMYYLFAIPLVGGIILAILLKALPNFSRLSLNLWNSAVAIVTTGTLFRGIVNLSGRYTTLDAPYWYIGISFAVLAFLSIFIHPFLTKKRTKVIEG